MSIMTIIIIAVVFIGAIVFSMLVERLQNKSVKDENKKESEAKSAPKK